MRFVERLGLAQRVVAVVAFGLVCGVVGEFIVSLGSGGADTGWFGYAPLTTSIAVSSDQLSGWEQLLVWLGLIVVWAAVALWLLRSPPASDDRTA
jgi:heme/copper-type cytochrome/quinol oxidase subunit 1